MQKPNLIKPIQHFFNMTNEHFFELAKPATDKSTQDGDPFLICHFSREQDKFKGVTQDMDAADAMIIVSHLIAEYGLNPEVIAAMNHTSRKTETV